MGLNESGLPAAASPAAAGTRSAADITVIGLAQWGRSMPARTNHFQGVMGIRERRTFTRVHLLREDADLGTGIPAADRAWAVEQCVVPALSIAPGEWDVREIQELTQGIGVLILDGLLLRRVGVDGRFGGELVGEGDLLRPWHGEDVDSTLPYSTGWRALSRTRLAVLDGRATARLCRYPPVIGAITGRALERARRLALMMAIIHHPRIDVRLHMLFWHLADRWGRVERGGVRLPLPLTHQLLGQLISAERPSVSHALARLSQSDLITGHGNEWHLHGSLDEGLPELIPSAHARTDHIIAEVSSFRVAPAQV